jgi:peptidoglycan/LPS O-acetylase OafA/YrhL
MGRISYPLYASHFVLVYAADRFTKWHPNAFTEIAVMTLSIGIADAVARWYEPAVRRALSTLTLPSATALATR